MADGENPAPEPAELTSEERTWGTLAHLSAFAAVVLPGLGNIIGPLVVWLLKKDQMPFVDDQGKEALNFQITMTIGFTICFLLIFVLIGFPLLFLLGLYDLVFTIIAAIKANEGERYRYPFALRLIN